MSSAIEKEPRRTHRRRLRSVRTPIAAALAGGATAVVLLAVGIVLAVNLITGVRSATELLNDKIELIIGLIETAVDNELKPAYAETIYIADILSRSLATADAAPASDLLLGALAATPQVGGLNFIRADGTRFLVTRDERGRPEVRTLPPPLDPLFAKALVAARDGAGPHWWRPEFVRGPAATFASAHAPVFHGRDFRGVVIAGVSMERLSGLVAELSAKEGLIAFILSGNGVLAHPLLVTGAEGLKPASPLPETADFSDEVLAGLAKAGDIDLFANKDRSIKVRLVEAARGEDWVVITKMLPEFGPLELTAGAYLSLGAVDAPLTRLLLSGASGLAALLAGLLLAIYMGKRIGRPLGDMANAATAVSSLELAAVPEMRRSRIREMDEQARAFNRMVEALRWFERYVPKSLVRRFVAQGAHDIPSIRQIATVCFTDIVGYTRLTDQMKPEDTAQLLNHHFAVLANAVEDTDGIVDKYMGDAMMAFWLSQTGEEDDGRSSARAAAEAAIQMAGGIEAENRQRVAEGRKPIAVRIGIHTGPLLVGNIGAPGRINYTAVGRTVNVAQRLERAARVIEPMNAQVRIAISEETARHLDGFRLADIGEHRVRGFRRRFKIFSLIVDEN